MFIQLIVVTLRSYSHFISLYIPRCIMKQFAIVFRSSFPYPAISVAISSRSREQLTLESFPDKTPLCSTVRDSACDTVLLSREPAVRVETNRNCLSGSAIKVFKLFSILLYFTKKWMKMEKWNLHGGVVEEGGMLPIWSKASSSGLCGKSKLTFS